MTAPLCVFYPIATFQCVVGPHPLKAAFGAYEHAEDIEMEKWMHLEQWFILKAKRPGVNARELASQYGLEELRHYIDRSRQAIDARRGWRYEAKVLFPELDVSRLKALSYRAKSTGSSGKAG